MPLSVSMGKSHVHAYIKHLKDTVCECKSEQMGLK